MALMLETLRSNEALDAGSFGVRFLAFTLGLNFSADDEFTDLDEFNPSVLPYLRT